MWLGLRKPGLWIKELQVKIGSYAQRWKKDYTFASTTYLNKVIFDQTLSNFGLIATFRGKLYINYSSHMRKPTYEILKLNCGARMWLTSATDCLLFLWEHSFKFTLLSYIFFARKKFVQAKWDLLRQTG